jgi:hypothetical protein
VVDARSCIETAISLSVTARPPVGCDPLLVDPPVLLVLPAPELPLVPPLLDPLPLLLVLLPPVLLPVAPLLLLPVDEPSSALPLLDPVAAGGAPVVPPDEPVARW